jgi:CheY-like chemotaxis protein
MNIQQTIDILLVEDNPTDAELALRSLRKHNLANRIEWVKDGAEALDFLFGRGKFAEQQNLPLPRVVLLDLGLPKVNGLEVLKALRADPRTSALPVVVLTSSKEEKDMVAAYQMGVNSFVSKPVAFNEFAKTVADMGFYWLLVNKLPPTS